MKVRIWLVTMVLAAGLCRGEANHSGPAPAKVPGSEYPRIHAELTRAGIKHEWVESSAAPIWTAWRKCLAEFAPRLLQ